MPTADYDETLAAIMGLVAPEHRNTAAILVRRLGREVTAQATTLATEAAKRANREFVGSLTEQLREKNIEVEVVGNDEPA